MCTFQSSKELSWPCAICSSKKRKMKSSEEGMTPWESKLILFKTPIE